MADTPNQQLNIYNEIALIDFRIFEKRDNESYEGVYGVNVVKVRGIMDWSDELSEVPASPDYVLGLLDLRGTIIPVVDLPKWLNIEPDDKQHRRKIIISEFNNVEIGFVIHEVKRIRHINWKNIEAARFSSSNIIERGKITGTTRIEDGRTLLILDLESIIDELDFYKQKADSIVNIVEGQQKFSGLALVLEDSNVARKRIIKNLHAMGFEVIEAINGEEGKQKLEELYDIYGKDLQSHLKIIVSDIEMPKMDGFHFASEVKKDPRFAKIPLLFNSSICDENSIEKSKKVGSDGYIVKFDPDLFYKEIKKLLS
ncbi:chemotaxis protein [Helicobacter fennelliae]|uniref:Chemotaxis protein CheV n=2 Tax=Helicobacter fennelliae TaxID=215 RepID=T1CZS0_9HELI|nr:chemotaxis protein [Helicobacter fennelliae]GAD18416.1 chemotaxis protein CheV [Helicobacter fennelliae MRY12-0050]SQB98858.1 chemotaxis signal transduction protein [Helicobacter fennelliae]STP08201.1 chemotaxis signal transduction protein [Helicobacter fennelliae]STQ83891.1 chemotaxis signal transduction protein [Helicobacter fennelliae]